jgi:hypothetical protein
MGKGKKVKIGYWYYFGIHMGFGRGPIDELVEIKVGDKSAWTGSITSNTRFKIDNLNLFGGEKGEGGIVGTVDMYMGDRDQIIGGGLPGMMSRMGVPMPQFRGVATMFYTGKVCAMNPYPKPWKMRVRRALKGWQGGVAWYPSKAVIPLAGGAIKAMNPAHILLQAVTDSDWGRGLSQGSLSLASYQATADKLYAEGFGLCLRWVRSGSITEFIQTMIDTIGAVQEVNRNTGLLELNLIRDDYDVNTLPRFTYGTGLLSVEDVEVAAHDVSVNQVVVKYHDPITDEDMTTQPVDNQASIQINGQVNTQMKEYFAVPTHDIAARLAIRDLQASMGFLRKMTIHLDRRGYKLSPGKPFRLTIPEFGIENIVMRVIRQQDGTVPEAAITVTCVEDVFGLPNASFIEQQPSGWVPPDRVARDPVIKRMREASWRDCVINLNAGALQSISNSSAWVTGLALKPNGMGLGYEFWTAPNGNGYVEQDTGDWVPTATLATAMEAVGSDTTVTLAGFDDLTDFEIGAAVLVDEEEMFVSAVNVNNAQVILSRGALDTVPASHAVGARVWVYTDTQAFDPTEYTRGANIYGKFLTFTSEQHLDISNASAVSYPLVARQARPYPPGNLRLNGEYYWNKKRSNGDVTLDWANRNRKSQDDQLFGHTYGNITPEEGQTTIVRVYNANGGMVHEYSGITGTSWTYTSAMAAQDGSLNSYSLQVLSYRDGLESWQSYLLPITRTGLGLNLGQNLGGSN